MPPVVAFIVAGAGLYAGAKWIVKELSRRAEEARVAADDMRKRTAQGKSSPRDLGPLEFDPAANVYRPKT